MVRTAEHSFAGSTKFDHKSFSQSGFIGSSIQCTLSIGFEFHLTSRRCFFARISPLKINITTTSMLVTSDYRNCSKESYSGSKQALVLDCGLVQTFKYWVVEQR